MREHITKAWNKIKWILFLIIWTAGVIGWTISIPIYKEMRKEADWAYAESVKLKAERLNIKDNGERVEDSKPLESKTQSYVHPKGGEEVKTASPLPSVETKINETFKEEKEIAIAVAKTESGLRPTAQGFNCRYNGVSQACRKGDEHKAWSTDCGIFQINVPGTTCPQHLFDPDENIRVAFEKYEKRGWQPWSAWKSGAYKKHLTINQ